ncbi:DUF934 domain-containing protein [Halomonas sp. 18H]|uniref:DUF934 domain-containing protein n=1 Tax=Halomonas almeriensis TaxID=308163 RepID=UPI002232AEBA|nr:MULTISPECIES: DUF934 domain-containing protein [Halomonas]MCW4151882.1 DUF934 domain-containing protein [Halomonas sp. 18H]MDN3554128.1 DUF934 domain-containing protein [Halomonas almeriensis]
MPDQQRCLIVDGAVVPDEWRLLGEASERPADEPVIMPLADWQAAREATTAPLLASDTVLTPELVAELVEAPLIAIDFPKFTDGRGYSLARLLRERHGYHGQIRAVGDVLIDQLFYMSRCGFNAFSLREDQLADDALKALNTFSRSYQPGTDTREPLFRRRLRERNPQRSVA